MPWTEGTIPNRLTEPAAGLAGAWQPLRVNAPGYSNSQVNKAAKTVIKYSVGGTVPAFIWTDDEQGAELDAAFDVILGWRAEHQYPLTKAAMGLRSMVASEGCDVEVSQRLKRFPTILGKILRYPGMRLAVMQDIGGCRAVLSNIEELRRVEKRVRKNRPPIKADDYITNPKPSGYRGVHLIVQYDGRSIEVQLRTQVMHQWAIVVERLSGRLQKDLKSSRGPAEVLAYLSKASEAMAIEETGGIVDQAFLDALEDLRGKAVPYLQGGGRP